MSTRHMIFKLHKIKNKEKIQEEAEQKQKTNNQKTHFTCRG